MADESGLVIIHGTLYSCVDDRDSVTIPKDVTRIGDGAFAGCGDLTDITIPDNVTSIGRGAFSRCEFLDSITLPDSITSIGERRFGAAAA